MPEETLSGLAQQRVQVGGAELDIPLEHPDEFRIGSAYPNTTLHDPPPELGRDIIENDDIDLVHRKMIHERQHQFESSPRT